MSEPQIQSDEAHLLEWANVLLAHRFLILVLTLAAGGAAYGLCKQARPLYEAETRLVANRDAAQLTLKGLFGGNLPRSMTEISDRFSLSMVSSYYAELLQSDLLLRPLAERKWVDGRTLPEIYEIEESPRGSVQVQTLSLLRNRIIDVQQDAVSGIISVRVNTIDRQLSAEIANSLVAQLQVYLVDSQTSSTSRLLKTAEDRTSQSQAALLAAENALHDFRKSNRTIVSPELQLRLEQLQRDVELQKELYIRLKTQVELLRLSEQQEADLVDIVREAEVPIWKSWPPTKAAVAGAAVFGFLLGVTIAFIRAGIRKLALREAPGADEFVRHIHNLNWLLPGLIFILPADVRHYKRGRRDRPQPVNRTTDEEEA